MYTRKTIQFYNARAAKYFDEWKNNQLLLPLLQCLMSRVPEKPNILDMGCGPGIESKRLAVLGAEVVGIDLGEVSLRIARQHAPQVTFLQMDVLDLDFAAGSFRQAGCCRRSESHRLTAPAFSGIQVEALSGLGPNALLSTIEIVALREQNAQAGYCRRFKSRLPLLSPTPAWGFVFSISKAVRFLIPQMWALCYNVRENAMHRGAEE
jgi:SAM-dependent methyltransferase